jgi:hypothetical protein
MPTNLTDVDTFTDPIQGPADSDAQAAAAYNLGFQGLANRTRNLRNDVVALEGRFDVNGDVIYPGSFQVRTIEVLPSAFEQSNNAPTNIPWRFRTTLGNAQTAKSAGSERAEVALQLNRLVPSNAVITNIWVLVTPGATRSTPDKIGARVFNRAPTVYTPGSEAVGAVGGGTGGNFVEDDGTTDLQSMLLNAGVDMTLGYAIWLEVFSGSGDTSDDLFHGVKIQFQDYGPLNT